MRGTTTDMEQQIVSSLNRHLALGLLIILLLIGGAGAGRQLKKLVVRSLPLD